MNEQKCAQRVILPILIMLLLVACGAPAATPITIPPTDTPTPVPPAETPTTAGQEDTDWNYVALGDSLLAEDWCNLPEQHAALIQADLDVEVNVVNLAVGGQTSEGLRRRMEQGYVRKAISEADIIVISIGGNDSTELVAPYFEGRCGGSDNQDCLREGLAAFQDNWDAILAEVVALASPTETLIRPLVMGSVSPSVGGRYGNSEGFDAFASNAQAMRDHLIQSCEEYGIPVADGRGALELQHIGPDGVHPTDEGIAVLAELLRDVGYEYGQ